MRSNTSKHNLLLWTSLTNHFGFCRVKPQRMGIQRCTVEDLKGGDAFLNAAILRDVFAGKKGPVADALCLNAGFALAACQVTETPEDGVALAQVRPPDYKR